MGRLIPALRMDFSLERNSINLNYSTYNEVIMDMQKGLILSDLKYKSYKTEKK